MPDQDESFNIDKILHNACQEPEECNCDQSLALNMENIRLRVDIIKHKIALDKALLMVRDLQDPTP